LYEGLKELEEDTHIHIHKENNLLFPAAHKACGGDILPRFPAPKG
jgi:iron-sulfur cluster repair protein YtfE (RIC family)